MPIFKIKNANGVLLGTWRGMEDEFFSGIHDVTLKELMADILENGVDYLGHAQEPESLIVVRDHVFKDKSVFPYAVKKFLEEKGYIVEEKDLAIEAEIRKIFENFSDDDKKRDILTRLSEMSYLEQTLYLKGLREIEKDVEE